MGPLAQFILALTNLVRSGAIRKVPQAIKFAEQQFGKVTPLLKKQIEKVFESAKKPLVGKAGKKEGTVLPLVKKIAEKKNEGITSLEDIKPLSEAEKDIAEIERSIGDLNKTEADADAFSESIGFPKNPRRPGGSLDQATGITRALARRILDRKGIEIGKKDPINVFTDTFGESISDVNNLAEEMIEIDARGGGMKDMDQMLEADGLFDIEIPTNPQKGLTDDELLELIKKTDEEKILTDFDPTGRKPNATGGRIGYSQGSVDSIADSDLKIAQALSAYRRYRKRSGRRLKKDPVINFDQFFELYATENFATGGRVRAASGGLADLLKL